MRFPLRGRFCLADGAGIFLLFLLTIPSLVRAEGVSEVLVTFDKLEDVDCECSMFPQQDDWEWILNDSLSRVGLTNIRWTHGCSDPKQRRSLQDDAGCPDWCNFFLQYCDCGCVSNCDDNEANGDEDGDENDEQRRYLLRQKHGEPQALEAFGNVDEKHHRRTNEVAHQFILDEQTAEYYLEFNIDFFDISVECLKRYDDHYKARVYLM